MSHSFCFDLCLIFDEHILFLFLDHLNKFTDPSANIFRTSFKTVSSSRNFSVVKVIIKVCTILLSGPVNHKHLSNLQSWGSGQSKSPLSPIHGLEYGTMQRVVSHHKEEELMVVTECNIFLQAICLSVSLSGNGRLARTWGWLWAFRTL